jgi:hypothetical protein
MECLHQLEKPKIPFYTTEIGDKVLYNCCGCKVEGAFFQNGHYFRLDSVEVYVGGRRYDIFDR